MKGENLCFWGKFKEPVHKASLEEKFQRLLQYRPPKKR